MLALGFAGLAAGIVLWQGRARTCDAHCRAAGVIARLLAGCSLAAAGALWWLG